MMKRLTIAGAALLLLPYAAGAVEYTLPDDGGWYQVQDATTYEEVCNSSDAPPCVLEAGVQYKVINHSLPDTDPEHRNLLTLSEDYVDDGSAESDDESDTTADSGADDVDSGADANGDDDGSDDADNGGDNQASSSRFERVGNRCPITMGDTVAGKSVSCKAQCPTGSELVGVIGCSLDYRLQTFDDEFSTSFLRSGENAARCFASNERVSAWVIPEASAALNVEIVCAR